MQASDDALDLSPPGDGRWGGALGAAVLVHALLILALAWGMNWQRDTPVVVQAELWAELPQTAAPRAVEPAEPIEPPPPEPVVEAPPPPQIAPTPTPPDIALQPSRLEQEQRQAQQRLEQQRAEQERRQQAEAARQAREQQAQLEAQRQQNLQRILGQAGASGAPQASGTAAQAMGPSAGYAARLVAAIRPNIVFTDVVSGNPRAEVEVRALPDGTIVGSRLLQSSGHPGWDSAVLRAIERTARLPRDENGRVPPTLLLGFRPLD